MLRSAWSLVTVQVARERMGGCLSSPTEGSNNQVAVAAEGASPVPEGKLGFDAMGKGKTAKEARLLLLGT